jgi:hypothetical protein
VTTPPSPSPGQPSRGNGQHIDVNSGDHSPVSINAPFSYAEQNGTANANANPPTATPTPWFSRSVVLWTAVGAIAAVAGVIVTIIVK